MRMELPSWGRSRSKRRANVEAERAEDVFQRGVKRSGIFSLHRVHWVLGGVILFAAAVAGVAYLRQHRLEQAAEGTRTLAEAAALEARAIELPADEPKPTGVPVSPIYSDRSERETKLDAALQKALDAETDKVALVARMIKASRHMKLGEPALALTAYDAFLKEAAADHPLRFLAIEGRALALEGQGKLEDALSAMNELSGDVGSHYRDVALWHQGRLLARLGRTDEAKQRFRQFLDEYAGKSELETAVNERLSALENTGGTPPPSEDAATKPANPAEAAPGESGP